MTDSKYGMYAWRKHKEFYDEVDGEIIFREDTPQYILDSYEEYCAQIESLESFATKETTGILGWIGSGRKDDKKMDTALERAQSFVQYRNQQKPIPAHWVADSIKYHDAYGHCFEHLDQFPVLEKADYRITDSIKHGHKVIILWKKPGYSMVSVFLFRDEQMIAIREYESKI